MSVSITKLCRDLLVGQSTYVEFDSIEQSQNAIRRLSLASRLPKEMKHFKFTCITYTAIAVKNADLVYINKVTRTQ